MEEYVSLLGEGSRPEESDLHRAFNLAFKVMTMVSISGENKSTDHSDATSEPTEWRNGDSLAQFFESAFPIRPHPTLNEKDETEIDIKSQLNVIQLQSAGLKFRGTDNLRDHLRINQETGFVELYQHTSVLKQDVSVENLGVGGLQSTEFIHRSVTFPYHISLLDGQRLPRI